MPSQNALECNARLLIWKPFGALEITRTPAPHAPPPLIKRETLASACSQSTQPWSESCVIPLILLFSPVPRGWCNMCAYACVSECIPNSLRYKQIIHTARFILINWLSAFIHQIIIYHYAYDRKFICVSTRAHRIYVW